MGKIVAIVGLCISLALVGAISALLVVLLPDESAPLTSDALADKGCIVRKFTSDSIVCVCNATYCDTIEPITNIQADHAVSYTSTLSGMRFQREDIEIRKNVSDKANASLMVDFSKRYQKIKGFGGAFTDAAGMNILNLTVDAQENLLKSYFSTQGIEYSIGRIPMASCDFSTRLYTYNDGPCDYSKEVPCDFEMKNFSLAMEDFDYKIPLIKRASSLSNRHMSFFGSPWSAPAWMKTNNALIGNGELNGTAGNSYHKAWALYFARFIEEYERNGIDIWGVTAQNEPRDGLAPSFDFQCMGFTAEQQRDFIKSDLGPTLVERNHDDIALMICDDQRQVLPEWAQIVLSDSEAAKYVSGVAVHWYMDFLFPSNRLTQTHEAYPDYFILGTEACNGAFPLLNEDQHVMLGSWDRGKRYSIDILQDLNNWAVGWVDWNLALNTEGGPNWVKNFVDAPIIVNAEKDEFYKQPMFYHMGHFSKFIPEESTRIEVSGPDQSGELKYSAFLHPDESKITVVILNTSSLSLRTNIVVDKERTLATEIPGDSIQTFVWTITM